MEQKNIKGIIYNIYPSEVKLAEELGWSKQKLNKITTGKKTPDIRELNQLAKKLNEGIESLMEIFLRM